jgi:integrase/recombinase XerD
MPRLSYDQVKTALEAAGHGGDLEGPLFRPVKNNRTKILDKSLHPTAISQQIVKHYARETGIAEVVHGICVHSLRATAATNALDHEADIQGSAVAGTCGYFNHADVRQASEPPGR